MTDHTLANRLTELARQMGIDNLIADKYSESDIALLREAIAALSTPPESVCAPAIRALEALSTDRKALSAKWRAIANHGNISGGGKEGVLLRLQARTFTQCANELDKHTAETRAESLEAHVLTLTKERDASRRVADAQHAALQRVGDRIALLSAGVQQIEQEMRDYGYGLYTSSERVAAWADRLQRLDGAPVR